MFGWSVLGPICNIKYIMFRQFLIELSFPTFHVSQSHLHSTFDTSRIPILNWLPVTTITFQPSKQSHKVIHFLSWRNIGLRNQKIVQIALNFFLQLG